MKPQLFKILCIICFAFISCKSIDIGGINPINAKDSVNNKPFGLYQRNYQDGKYNPFFELLNIKQDGTFSICILYLRDGDKDTGYFSNGTWTYVNSLESELPRIHFLTNHASTLSELEKIVSRFSMSQIDEWDDYDVFLSISSQDVLGDDPPFIRIKPKRSLKKKLF